MFFIGIFFESACPWMSYHIGFITATTYQKYAASYATTLMGLINIGKIIPVSLTITLLDYMNYTFLFFTLNIANMLFIALSFRDWATVIDQTPIEEYHAVIEKLADDVPKSIDRDHVLA